MSPPRSFVVFRNVRSKAEGAAGYLAKDLGLPSAQAGLAALPAQDPLSSSVRLPEHTRGGIAIHSSNCSRKEREDAEGTSRDRRG